MAVSMIGPKFYAWNRDGKPLAFGKLYTYQARTNTPKPTYQSEDQVVENANPVILNGEGYADVYLDGSYKMVLKDDKDNEIWSSDPVTANQADEWINCFAATYVSPTSFKVSGNQTDTYLPGRKIRIDNNVTEYSYTTIESAVYAGGETSVVVKDAVVLTGISSVCTSVVSENSSLNRDDVMLLIEGSTDYIFDSVDEMVSGNLRGGEVITHKEGNQYRTGGTGWVVKSASGDIDLGDNLYAKAITALWVDDFGAVGDDSTDDTDSLKLVISISGEIVFTPNKTYICKDRLKLQDGSDVNLNGATVKFECVGNVENFVMASNCRLHSGVIVADNDPDGVSSTLGCRPVRVAGKSSNPDGSDPELVSNWIIENLKIYPGLIYGNGETRGGRAIIIRDNVTNGIVRNIHVDGRGMTSGTVYAEWGEHEYFPDPTVLTVHPRNVLIENVVLRNAGKTGTAVSPSLGCSGSYNFTIKNCDIDGADVAFIASMGEPGRGYCSDDDKKRILRGISFEDCIATNCNVGVRLFGRGSSIHPLADDGIPHGDVTFKNCHFRGRLGQPGADANMDGLFMNSFGNATFIGCSVRDFTRYGAYPVFGNGYFKYIAGDMSFNGDTGFYMIGDQTTDGDTNLYSRGLIQGNTIFGNCKNGGITNPEGIRTFYTRYLSIKDNWFEHGGSQDICVNAGSSVFARYLQIVGNNAFDPAITRMWRTSRTAGSPNDETYRILVHNNMFDSATCSIEGTHVFTTDGL